MILRYILARIGVGVVAAGAGWLAAGMGYVVYAKTGTLEDAAYVAKVGAVIGFLVGAISGNRRFSGRPGWMLTAIVLGIAFGAVAGHIWGRIEHSVVWHQIEAAGCTPNNKGAGFSSSSYDSIGLQYGICVGGLAGLAVGCVSKRSTRFSSAIALIIGFAFFVGVGMMNAEFRAQSAEEIRQSHPSTD